MNDRTLTTHVLLPDYENAVASTDKFAPTEITPILLGLFGEVGSVLSTSKKLRREKDTFIGYKRDVEEELGDTLWYVTALCRRFQFSLSDIFHDVLTRDGFKINLAANGDPNGPIAKVVSTADLGPLDSILLRLGEQSARLLKLKTNPAEARPLLSDFAHTYLEAVQALNVSFSNILNRNIAKTQGRFVKPSLEDLPNFDKYFPEEEQIPHNFEIRITQRADGRSYLQWNKVFIGDPLSDNIGDRDGYRFHDVFHFANAAVLHWSPTFRALIKHKRKSRKDIDEEQDSGRAIVIEEGLSAYIFSHAKALNFFKDQDSVSFDILKAIQNFVRGYEVEKCPLYLWEQSIIQGYNVFRQIRDNGGGIVIGNRNDRTLQYKPLEGITA